jgi:ubiquinone/menaquinone biosynthesis C-methylase UbiE
LDDERKYVLGQSESAARRLAVQDAHWADASERLLDELALRPNDRVVELGCGPGTFSRRILRRLGVGGVLIGVDATEGLLNQARHALAGSQPARFEVVHADIVELGSWLDGADVIVGRAVLHHVPMAEMVFGRLRAAVRPGTRVGFLEPDFRAPLARVACMEAKGRTDVEPLRAWAVAINQLYQARRLSPAVGATLARALELAGYHRVREFWEECRSDLAMLENIVMFYDEVRERLIDLGIMTADEIARQQLMLHAAHAETLPPAWATFRVACEA